MSDRPSDADEAAREARIEALFHAALERPAAERSAFVREACGGDASVAREVGELLASFGEAPTYLDRPAWGMGADLPDASDSPDEASVVGARVGPYVIRRLLGRGGMGEVYLADQTEPLRREVALKRIKLGMDTHEVVRRFEAERSVLARLGHPNIAAVHDAGVTPAGRPYFVMEYVDGERITEYCDRRRLGVAERLSLFVQVCQGVQHAHQKGVIHRDIKPGNVLVKHDDGRPVPKIIDFGVAKATSGGGDHTAFTRSGQLIGTPGYMSPEQARAGHDVDTRTDVYSLGVVLYELLTGVLPFEVAARRAASEASRRAPGHDEAPRPSVRVTGLGERARVFAARRRCEPRGLLRKLRGDLDWIALRALERDPARRYASASELAADLLRHLDGEPVSAGPPGITRRAVGFVLRHRREAAVGAAAVLLAGAGAFGFALVASLRSASLERDLDETRARLQRLDLARGPVQALDPPTRAFASTDARTSVAARNVGHQLLEPGDLVAFAGRADEDGPHGPVAVLKAERDAGAPFLGVVTGALVSDVDGALHVERGPVAPGWLLEVAVQGTLVSVKVDGPVLAKEPLGLSSRAGFATRHDGDGVFLGVALETHGGDGPAQVTTWLEPAWTAAPAPRAAPTSTVFAWDGAGAAPGSGGAEPRPVESIAWILQRGAPDGAPASAHDARPGGLGGVPVGDVHPLPAHHVTSDEPLTSQEGDDVHDPGGEDDHDPHPGTWGAVSLGGPAARNVLVPQDAPTAPGKKTPKPLMVSEDDVVQGGSHGADDVDLAPSDGAEGEVGPDDAASDGDAADDDLSGDHQKHALGLDDGDGAPAAFVEHWGDFDGDGLPDLLLDVVDEGLMFFLNRGQGVFTDLTAALHLDRPTALGSLRCFDHDGDGRLDLVGVQPDGVLALQRGDGRGRFVDVTVHAGLGALPAVLRVDVFAADGGPGTDLRLSTAQGGLWLLIDTGSAFRIVVLKEEVESDPDAVDGGSAHDVAAPKDSGAGAKAPAGGKVPPGGSQP